ncbi:MAG: hypothetical protein EPN97_11760 [Alphaproteobacteria bacterium]|nr:MAG: hypothetical protein EPN97_11760 [Alphaproteobacteria bacterium]
MQNKTPEDSTSLRDVIDRYSPIVGGRTGLVGDFLKVVAKAVDILPNVNDAPAPVPSVLFTSRNLAGQTITTNDLELAATFKRMEQTLQKSFKKASGTDATADDRESFVKLAEQVQKDAAILAAKCFITKPQGDARYQFVLEPEPGQHIPLAKAFAAVQQPGRKSSEITLVRYGSVTVMQPAAGFKKASIRSPVV